MVSELLTQYYKKQFVIFLFIADQVVIIFEHES